jgi:hypothetical protein
VRRKARRLEGLVGSLHVWDCKGPYNGVCPAAVVDILFHCCLILR